jgi:DNA-directed RNA polymerase specialized sigma24 family protein
MMRDREGSFTYPIQGERLERLKARNSNNGPRHPGDWDSWIAQESPSLLTFLRFRLRRQRDPETGAEDAFQDTWRLAYGIVCPIYSRSEFSRGYLFALAMGAASEVMRKGGRERPYGDFNDGDEDGEGGGAGGLIVAFLAVAGLSEAELLRRFEELLELAEPPLSDEEKTIVRGKLIEDNTFAEIGRVLEIPSGTASGKYYRAIRKLFLGIMNRRRSDLTEEEIRICELHKGEPPMSLSKIAEERQLPVEVVEEIYLKAAAKIWQWAFGPR